MAKSGKRPADPPGIDHLLSQPVTLVRLTHPEGHQLASRLRKLPATWERDALLAAISGHSTSSMGPDFVMPLDPGDIALCRLAGVEFGEAALRTL